MRTILSVLFVGFVLTAPGCNERKSTPVGGEVIDLDDWGQFRQVLFQPASRDSVYRAAIPTNAGPLLLVGEWSGYQTRSLLKFEALPESVQVSSASVTLVTYDVIDTLTTLQTFVPESIWVVVSLLDTDWNGSDVTFDTPLSGTPVETVAVGRSRGDSLVFSLPTGVVQAWIDGTEENNGLLLSCAGEPIVAQGEGFIKEFYSLNSQSGPPPQLRVTWAVTDTSDTTLNTPPTADVFVVKRDIEWPIEGWPDWLMVGNGAVYRSLLQFNVRDSIPEEATVIRALFTLYVEGEYSFF
ncbi:MAG: DNRLRE domain-containing protein, partial [bacterium]